MNAETSTFTVGQKVLLIGYGNYKNQVIRATVVRLTKTLVIAGVSYAERDDMVEMRFNRRDGYSTGTAFKWSGYTIKGLND